MSEAFPKRLASLQAPGADDTHSEQVDALTKGLTITAASLLAFQRDREARGIADRVVTLVWSEFGRRVKENGSRAPTTAPRASRSPSGTRPRRHGRRAPGPERRPRRGGDLRPTSDYRGLYAALLEQWLDTDAGAVIPDAGHFPRRALIG